MTGNLRILTRRCGAVLLAAFCLMLSQAQAKTRQNKVITANPAPRANPPITIRQIMLAGKPVELGVPFAASDSWLEDLSVKVENNSGKAVTYFDLGISFPNVEEGGPTLTLPLSFGQVPGAPNASGVKETLAPGASATLGVGRRADGLRQALSDNQHQADKVNVRVMTVLFEDGTLWRNGFEGQPDPTHPLRWDMKGAIFEPGVGSEHGAVK
ncbi:MAG TPA: hypothetical protein VE713_02090 [Pyrinomonadaceae bacterium]|nr:hypothetical protein [Pyrinomonadaceae bacterium]